MRVKTRFMNESQQTPSARLEDYERPSVTVDVLVFCVLDKKLKVALIRRGVAPFAGCWALPGGFVRADESPEDAARREVEEEAGVSDVFLEQLYTFGEPSRDPRGRVITVAYYALVPGERIALKAATDADDAQWFDASQTPPLAFDHDTILKAALERLRAKLEYSNIAFGLLPARFSLSDLQQTYEIILDRPLDKRNFRKRIQSLGLVEATGKTETGNAHRPAQLFRFKKRNVVVFK